MLRKIICTIVFLGSFAFLAQAQEQQKEKTPEELAAMEVEILEKELELTPSQAFYVDSILVSSYTRLKMDFESLKSSGMQNASTYRAVSDKSMESCKQAMQRVLDEQQYIKYLRHIGQGKEYRKGKDGKYYKKENSKKDSKK